jgi:serine protease Do
MALGICLIAVVAMAMPTAAHELNDIADVVEKISRAVVRVYTEREYPLIGKKSDFAASGTIISPDGKIVTIRPSDARTVKYEVTLHDGRRLPANLIAEDLRFRLCLLKIDAENLDYLTPTRTEPRLGQRVLSVYSTTIYERLVQDGIVAGLSLRLGNPRPVARIRTSLSPETGAGGAPLVTLDGHLLGIVGHYDRPQSFSPSTYAVHAPYLGRMLDAAKGDEVVTIRPGYLNLDMRLDDTKAKMIVTRVAPGSSAEKAGLKQDDVLLAFDGVQVRDLKGLGMLHLQREQRSGGEKIPISVLRDGKEETVEVTLDEGAAIDDEDEPKVELSRPGQTKIVIAPPDPEALKHLSKEAREQVEKARETLRRQQEELLKRPAPTTFYIHRPEQPAVMEDVKALRDKVNALSSQLEKLQKQLEER